ncbi:MAG: SDR family oxidoreductase, partial [Steroidobacteraceae bacterium]|nr:SDR family oxidoreductase [Steroidobacteraceae bacterium]MDW8258879.1 SDR family oxidoreductase [Gammaproteobacteria bacterium]
LQGKIALVTGAASGLGKADALALAREGARVVITDIDEAGGREVERIINASAPGCAVFLSQDVASETRWIEVFGQIEQRFGGLHVLVNNAGIVRIGTPENTTLEDFRLHLTVMTESVFLGCKYGIPLMRKSGGGSIINMCSTATHLGYPVFYAYSAAKGAVRSMTKAIAVHCQMHKYNIRCNSIHAGAIATPMVAKASQELGIDMSAYEQMPAGLGQPEDVANLVVYLASDESRFINGSEILLDNALTIQ